MEVCIYHYIYIHPKKTLIYTIYIKIYTIDELDNFDPGFSSWAPCGVLIISQASMQHGKIVARFLPSGTVRWTATRAKKIMPLLLGYRDLQ